MDVSILALIGSVIVAFLGLSGVVYTARSARAANARTLETQSYQAQLDGLEKRANAWRDDVEALRADIVEDRKQHAEEIAAVRGDLEKVKTEAAQDRLARHELVYWARAVISLMRDRRITFPPPPPGVSDTDPGLIPLDRA